MRARVLSTSIAGLVVLALAAVPAGAAPRQQAEPNANCLPAPTVPATPAPAPAVPPPDAPAAAPTTATAASMAGGAAYGADPDKTPVMPTGCVIDGKAYPPADAPAEVQQAIWAGNALVGKPYKYGGGHARVNDTGYDCSGTVSYALLAGDLLEDPLDSSSFMRWGEAGPGAWITVYTNPGHAYVVIAGLRLDTSAAGDPAGNSGPRWRPVLRSTKGFRARHPEGF